MGDHPGVPEDLWSYLDRIDEALRERMAYIEAQLQRGATIAQETLLNYDADLHAREEQLQRYWAIRAKK